MLTDVKDKVVWITGASSGIGAAAAVALSGAGARVIVSGRREDRLNALAQTLDGAEVAVLDVSDATAVDAAVAMILDKFGRIDILVHSAGLNVKNRAWSELTIEDWNTVIQVDLNGAFYCCQAVLPFMRTQKDGLIINISSWAGRYVSRVSGGAYSTAKHALNAMTESINQENCIDGIRACAICPGEVATEILDRRPVPVSREDRSRMVQAEDLGDLILHVCQTPAHVCLNEITISPTWNRGYIKA
ncbi:MAG: SDR family NAD(P)-dependent oxidoreductase [Gammaproteobacteria bacterium TMED182]|nr:oxidoreductase [Gammaproteobacteria bacterium]RPG52453.1 MAG: SDR family NAD(P)-dependent oxidoreductase [Gammaproteobacteria bacterium TMED182]